MVRSCEWATAYIFVDLRAKNQTDSMIEKLKKYDGLGEARAFPGPHDIFIPYYGKFSDKEMDSVINKIMDTDGVKNVVYNKIG